MRKGTASPRRLKRGEPIVSLDGQRRGTIVADAGTFREADMVQVKWSTGEVTMEHIVDVRRER